MVVTGVRTRSHHPVYPISPHTVEDSFGLQERSPLACQALQNGGHTRDHWVTSCPIGVLTPIHTGEAMENPNIRETL